MAESQNEPQRKTTVSDKIRGTDASKLDMLLRVVNMLNAIFLATAGVLAFIMEALNLLLILSAIYIIAFSAILCCFETQLGFIERIAYRDCGFMFRWQGRIIFFVFVGTLAFGISKIGIAAGCFTMANVIFNTYVLCVSPSYSKYKSRQAEDARRNAGGGGVQMKEMARGSTSGGTTGAAQPTSSASAVVDVGSPVWEKILDEESGSYYYYNNKTKETRWDAPEGH